jgi:hypothetical protein
MAAWVRADALAPNLVVRVMGPLAGLGWRRRARRPTQNGDAIRNPLGRSRRRGGVVNRPSLLTKLRMSVR